MISHIVLLLPICIYIQRERYKCCTWPCSIFVCTVTQPHFYFFFIVDYLILWLSCPLFLEWLAHLQDCKCGNTPCDLTPAILARLLQTFSHADLIKYSLEVAQRKMILDPIFLPLKSPDILITPKGKLKDKKVIHFTVEELYLLTFPTNVVKFHFWNIIMLQSHVYYIYSFA